MFNIFEQPWTLLLAAVIAHIVIHAVRSFLPEKRQWWQRLVPIVIILAAFGLDLLVKTDLEKISDVIKVGMKAAEEENAEGIEAILSDSYSDSFHNTKKDLMNYCRALLSEPLVEKNKKRSLIIERGPTQARMTLTVATRFDSSSIVYKNYKPTMMIKMRLEMRKVQGEKWLITRAEPVEFDNYPVTWRDIK